MSIYTLLVSDTARSGCRLDLIQPVFQEDDIPRHPFVWSDMCPRPELDCIPADLEVNLIEAAVAAANAVLKVFGGTMGMIIPAHEKYLKLIVDAQKCIDTYKGRYDFSDTLTDTLSRFRTEVLFNIGTAMFHQSLAHGWMDARYGKAVEHLAETAAFFDMILSAPYRRDDNPSDRAEASPDNIRAMALLALGTAKEIEVAYLMKDAGNFLDKVADVAHQTCHFFRVLNVVAERSSSLPDYSSLLNYAQIKRCYYEGLAYFLMSADPETTKGKARRRKAQECFEFAFGYANLHMPGERRQVELELQTIIEQTANFRTLVKKNMIPFAAISSRKKRFFMSDEQFSNAEKKAKLTYDLSQRYVELGELTEERAASMTAKSSFMTPAQKHKAALEESIGAIVKETTPYHPNDDLVDVVLRTDHVNLLQRVAAVDSQKEEQKQERTAAAAGANPTANLTLAEQHKKGTQMAAALAPFYYVQSLVKLQCAPDPVDISRSHKVAFAFIVDVVGIERPSATSVKELVSLAVRTSLIQPDDRIAMVVPLDGDDQFQVELLGGDEKGKASFHEKLMIPCKMRTPSYQPSLIGAVQAARTALDTLPKSYYKHVFVITDFGMRTMSSFAGNWTQFNKLRAPGQILGTTNPANFSTGDEKRQEECVRVHTYSVAGDATSHLLRLMSANTRGDYGYWLKTNDISQDNSNFSQMRSWLVNLLTMTKRTYARDVVVQVTAAADSKIYSVSSGHSKPIDPLNTKPQLARDMCASIPDLAHTFAGEVLIVNCVPPEACRQDVVHLGFSELRYTRADGSIRKIKCMLLNESNSSLIDRESFKWLQQLRIEGCEGNVLTKYDGGTFRELKARGVETLVTRDTVVCDGGNISLSSIEGATVETGSVAEFTVDYIGTNEFVLNVESGDYKIKTTSFGTCTLNIVDEYKIIIPENTMARIGFEELPEGWTLSVKSIIGSVTIHTISALDQQAQEQQQQQQASASASASSSNALIASLSRVEGEAPATPPILELQAPRCTMCRLGESPMTPWVGSEDGLLGWKPLAHRVADRVLALADIDMYHCRSLCLPVMGDVNRWMQRRNRTGTIIPNNAARRCRKFLIWNRITDVRQELANSSSQAIGGAEFASIKAQLDVASAFASPMKYDQITWEVVRKIGDATRALETLRPAGSTTAYAPRDFEDQVSVLMSTREREAAERERIMREKEREIKNAELRRRKELIASVFPLWDFEGDFEVSVADAQATFYDLPCRETPVIVKVFERWDRLISATTTKRSFGVEQLVTILYTFTQEVDSLDFNKFFEQISVVTKNIADLIDISRIHRALFALFRWFDHDDNKGWITMRRIASVVHAVFGDDAVVFRRIEKITKAAIDALNRKMPKNFPPPPVRATGTGSSRASSRTSGSGAGSSTPNRVHRTPTPNTHNHNQQSTGSVSQQQVQNFHAQLPTQPLPEAQPVTLETLDSQRLTLSTFIHAMLAFWDDCDEPSTHREIEMLFNHLYMKAKLPQDAIYVVAQEKRNYERQRLLDWDLPHVFDGVRDKDLAKVLDPNWVPPPNVNDLCRAPCLILGLTKIKYQQVHKEDVRGVQEEYWKTLRKLLRTDSDSVFRYFKNFPPLSLSNRQVRVLSTTVDTVEFDANQLGKLSPLFAALCNWTKLILRIGWLVHEWQKPAKIEDAELDKTMNTQLEIQQLQQARAAAEAVGVYRHNSVILNNSNNNNNNNIDATAAASAAAGGGFESRPRVPSGEFSSNSEALKQPGSNRESTNQNADLTSQPAPAANASSSSSSSHTPAKPVGEKPPQAPRR